MHAHPLISLSLGLSRGQAKTEQESMGECEYVHQKKTPEAILSLSTRWSVCVVHRRVQAA